MARPKKTNLDYFPFDVDFFDDEKIVAIAGEFGIKGELTTIKLLCAIYRNGYYIEWNEMLQTKLARLLPGVSLELLNSIVSRLVKWGFFDPNLFSTARILTSRGVQRRYFDATKWRALDDNLPYLLVSQRKTPISQRKTPVSQLENPTKEKKINKKISPVGDIEKAAPPPTTKMESVDDFTAAVRNDDIWLEACMMNFRLSRDALLEWIGAFIVHCKMFDKKPGTVAEAKRYFCSWLPIALRKKNEPQPNNRPRITGCKGKRTTPAPNCGLIENNPA